MSNLVNYNTSDGIELLINHVTGECFASQSATARMCDVNESTIRRFVTSAQITTKTAEIQTTTGLKTSALLDEDGIYTCLEKYRPKMLVVFARLGLRMYLHNQAGFEYKVVEEAEPPKPELPPADIRAKDLASTLQFFDIDISNPRFKQGLQDLVLNTLGIGQPPLSSESSEIWLGVAERAEQLGYPAKIVTDYQSPLGKFVKKRISYASKMEKRLCKGTQRPINLYLLTPELDDLVKEYMDAKIEALEERKEVN